MKPNRVHRSAVTALLLTVCVIFGGCTASSTKAATTAPTTAPPATSGPSSTTTTTTTSVPTTQRPLGRAASWQADLDQIVPEMEKIHPNLFHGISRTELEGAIAELSTRVPKATNDELMVGVMRVVAMVSAKGCEGHTGAFVWGTGTYPVDSMPLRLWLFDDRLVVVDALAPYRALIGSEIDAIEGRPTAEVLAAIKPLVPHDNDQTIRLVTPRLVLIPQVLRGLGLADDGPISLTVRPATSQSATTDVTAQITDVNPISMADYNGWSGPYGLHLPVDPTVRYLSRIGDALWWEMLPDGKTMYVQYNRVDQLPTAQLANLRSALSDKTVTRVVLDVRHNYGGELSALDPIMSIFKGPTVDRPAALYVLTGRNTFSAGSLLIGRLQHDTHAIFVGETMGGCPTTWGNSSDLTLAYSGIVISVAHDLSVGVDAQDARLTIEPDISVTLTFDDWANRVDPALESALAANK